jgi:Putative glutamine amidotransferase
MNHGFSVNFSPIGGSWPVLLLAIGSVTALTLWAYAKRLRGTTGRWRWFALGLRLLAILLCLMAALRPKVTLNEKKKQAASLVYLFDASKSMGLADEFNGQTRWSVAKEILKQAQEQAKTLGPDLNVKIHFFDSKLSDAKPNEKGEYAEPHGLETRLGTAILEANKAEQVNSKRIARMVIVSDFTSNNGPDPLEAARQVKGSDQAVKIITVGLGTETAGNSQRDISLRDIVTSPTVFVKNQVEVRGTVVARGYNNQELNVELYVEGQATQVAKTTVKVKEGSETAQITGVKYVPQTPGEKLLTLKVTPKEGEVSKLNNDMSTFISVLSGGLNVLFLQGHNSTFEYRFLGRSIMQSTAIQMDGLAIRRAASADKSEVDDSAFAAGKYNVYVLCNLPAEYLTPKQHGLLVEAVKKGAGLIMLGGHASFGPGGWADTPVAGILPCDIHPGDGEIEEPIKLVPTATGLDSFILKVGATNAETAKIWDAMPPMLGTNRFGERKPSAAVLATSPEPGAEPVMMSMDVGLGRVIAFGGETWVWGRQTTEEARLAYRKFWRQSIFFLSHKEDDSENQVKLSLDRRRIGVGEKLELTATVRDAKGAPIADATYECKIQRDGPEPMTEPVELYNQGEQWRGTRFATEQLGVPGNYTATVVFRRGGKEIGHDSARFLVYQDDRELENPSADLKLAREIAELTGGEMVTPEKLATHLKGIDRSTYTEYVTDSQYEVWDNWPFLLLFAFVLTLEWWLRKRHGWV